MRVGTSEWSIRGSWSRQLGTREEDRGRDGSGKNRQHACFGYPVQAGREANKTRMQLHFVFALLLTFLFFVHFCFQRLTFPSPPFALTLCISWCSAAGEETPSTVLRSRKSIFCSFNKGTSDAVTAWRHSHGPGPSHKTCHSPTPKPLHLDIEWAWETESCWLLSLCPWPPFTPLPHSLPLTHIYSFFYIKELKKEKKKA